MTNIVTSQTPLRISFFGGGTDYPEWYLRNGGSVLSTTINKYCHIMCIPSYPFHEYKYRVVYSDIEVANHIESIKHPAVREILKSYPQVENIEIHYSGDLPAGTGLGASSAFSVGLINALEKYIGNEVDKDSLAKQAIFFEREKMKEVGGCQDQVATSHGGLNQIHFSKDGKIEVQSIKISKERRQLLQDHLMLFYSGIKRKSSEVAASVVERMKGQASLFRDMQQIVDEGVSTLCNEICDINEFGHLLHTNWQIKRKLSPMVSNSVVDDMYDASLKAGAVGGKLLGAGGGGFLLLFVDPGKQKDVEEILSGFKKVDFSFDQKGSQIFEQERKNINSPY